MDFRVLWLLSKKFSPLLIMCGIGWIILSAPIPDSDFKLFQLILGESLAFFVFYIWGFTFFYNSPITRRVLWTIPVSRRTLSVTLWFGSIGIPILQILLSVILTLLIFYFSNGTLPSENLVPAIWVNVLIFNLTYSTTFLLYTADLKKISLALLHIFVICLGIWTPWNFEIFREFFYRHEVFLITLLIASLILSVYSVKESEKIPLVDFLRYWKRKEDNARTEFAWSPLWRSIRCNPFYKAIFFSFLLSSIASLLLWSIPVLANFMDSNWDITTLFHKHFIGPIGVIYLALLVNSASQGFFLSLRNYAVIPVSRWRIFLFCSVIPFCVSIPYLVTLIITHFSLQVSTEAVISFLSLHYSMYLFIALVFLCLPINTPSQWGALVGLGGGIAIPFLLNDRLVYDTFIGCIVGLGSSLVLLPSLWYSLKKYKQPFSHNVERYTGRMTGQEMM